MRTFFAGILLFILSFQVLPVKEIGKMLFKGQMTEEVQDHSCSDDDCCKIKKGIDAFYITTGYTHRYIDKNDIQLLTFIHNAERIPHFHSADVLTPPPDLS